MSARPDLMELYESMPAEDTRQWRRYMIRGSRLFEPDLVIAPDGNPYLYRWYMVPLDRSAPPETQIMFHIQVASDPERPLHDHPWDNVSHILSGGYREIMDAEPENQLSGGRKWHDTPVDYGDGRYADRVANAGHSLTQFTADRQPGEVIMRRATTAHRLVLPKGQAYTMSLFTTGPKVRDWGFWYPDRWHHNAEHVAFRGTTSVHLHEGAKP